MITDAIKQLLQDSVQNEVFFNEPMARLTTIRVGGPADAIVYPRTVEEVQGILNIAQEHKLPVFVFGWGSNLLVRDGGLRGIVINLGRGFQQTELNDINESHAQVQVGAGVKIPALLDFFIKKGLAGMEFMAGIPATLGGAIWMNAGTPQGEIGQHVESVTLVTKQGRIRTLDQKSCGFTYRRNCFPAGSIVLEATLKLQKGDADEIRAKIEKNKTHRIETQPLNVPNLGSVFKNPSKKQFAGQLIEEAGLKDVRVGSARISEKHGNFIVNEGQASARDVISLIGLIKDKVKEKCNVKLETEVHIVGEKTNEDS